MSPEKSIHACYGESREEILSSNGSLMIIQNLGEVYLINLNSGESVREEKND